MERQRKELRDQILRNKQNDYVAYQKQMQMERVNLSKAQTAVNKQHSDQQKKVDDEKAPLKAAWQKQLEETKIRNIIQKQNINMDTE